MTPETLPFNISRRGLLETNDVLSAGGFQMPVRRSMTGVASLGMAMQFKRGQPRMRRKFKL
jgi:hypothetical protein